MSRYAANGWLDAAIGEATPDLVRSIRGDAIARLRDPRAASPEPSSSSRPGAACSGIGGMGGALGVRASDLASVREMVELCRRIMFPGFFDPDPITEGEIEPRVIRLTRQVAHLLDAEVRSVMRYAKPEKAGDGYCEHVVRTMLRRLAAVREMLALDVQAAYDGDPAAEHTDEVILCYPGLDAIFTHRLAHELYELDVPLLPRVMAEQAHSRTGIDIHPGATIGEKFFIDHGSATVIGETSTIGRQVKIYQGVTLGARSFPKDDRGRVIRGIKRHPTIGDRVTIYAGAVILGGDTVIGDDCVIAGGVFVTSSVAPGHVVQQTRPEPVLKPTAANARVVEKKAAEAKIDLGWMESGAGI